MTAGAVAAIIIRREKDMVSHFVQQRATSVESAQTLDALRVEHNMIFRRLEDRAIIRQGKNGTYYLDEQSWLAVRRTRQRVLTVVILIAVLLLGYTVVVTSNRVSPKDVPTSESKL